MTRVAILEADPRICGPASWSQHVKYGMQQLGFECDIVSPTKSGKAKVSWGIEARVDLGTGWTSWAPDVVPSWSAATTVLKTYDFIILPEPKQAHQDKDAAKAGSEPPYITWLRQSGVPFLTALHGPQYDPKQWAPYVGHIAELPNFVPVVITPSEAFAATNPALIDPRIKLVHHMLPYRPMRPIDLLPARRRENAVVGFTGRMMPNLGPQLLAAATEALDCASTELWGSASVGMGANSTYLLWKMMCELGWDGERVAHKLNCSQCKTSYDGWKIPPAGLVCTNCGFVMGGEIRPSAWWVQKNGRQVAYFGGFEVQKAVDTCERFDVHVKLTSSAYSYGLEEFTTLEAIDAGCVVCYTPSFDISGFAHKSIPVNEPKSTTMILRDKANEQLSAVTQAVNDALHLTDEDRRAAITYNRHRLREINDPTDFCRTWLEAW